MELQLGTPAAFAAMKKGAEAHDRELFFRRFPLLDKLQSLANGAEGKITMPSVGKGGVTKGGDPEQGKHILNLFSAFDLMHPHTAACTAVTYEGTAPVQDGFDVHVRDRSLLGSRWFRIWQSPGRIFRLDSITYRLTGKPPQLGKFSFVLSGVAPGGAVTTLFEEALVKVPVVRGESQLVVDGLTHHGFMLGNLSCYESILLEYFEPDRSFQWADLSDFTIKALVVDDAAADGAAVGTDHEVESALGETSVVPVSAAASSLET